MNKALLLSTVAFLISTQAKRQEGGQLKRNVIVTNALAFFIRGFGRNVECVPPFMASSSPTLARHVRVVRYSPRGPASRRAMPQSQVQQPQMLWRAQH